MNKKRNRKNFDDSEEYSSDSDEEVKKNKKKVKSNNNKNHDDSDQKDSDDETSDSDNNQEDEDWGETSKKSKKPKKMANIKKPINKKSNNQSDVEEGEVSDSDSEVFDDGFDDEYMGDEDDRQRLELMTEKEREEEIFHRSERREMLKTRFLIQKKMKDQQKAEKRKTKNKSKNHSIDNLSASSSTLNISNIDDNKSSDYNAEIDTISSLRRNANENKKKETGVTKALENLKSDREKKKKIEAEKLQKEKLRTEDVYSSSDSDDGSESKSSEDESRVSSEDSDSNDEKKTESENLKLKQFISTKEELTRIKLSRSKIEKWCHAPFFSKVATGCFVKIGIGNNSSGPVYRVAKIMGIVETGKIYNLGPTRTNKGFKLQHGKEERVFRFEFISNQAFSDGEFNMWKESVAKNDTSLPTLHDVEVKEKEIKDALLYQYKDEDIDHIVKEKKKFSKTDTKKIATVKVELIKQKELAEEMNDVERLREIEAEIAELDERQNDIERNKVGQFAYVAQINQRNRFLTSKGITDAIKVDSEKPKEGVFDPFTRRKCVPQLVSRATLKNLNEKTELKSQEAATKAKEEKDKKATDTTKVVKNQPVYEDLLDFSKPKQSNIGNNRDVDARSSNTSVERRSDDLFSVHNFDLDINIPVSLNENQFPCSTGGNSSSTNLSSLPKRSYNLEAYKKLKGLI